MTSERLDRKCVIEHESSGCLLQIFIDERGYQVVHEPHDKTCEFKALRGAEAVAYEKELAERTDDAIQRCCIDEGTNKFRGPADWTHKDGCVNA